MLTFVRFLGFLAPVTVALAVSVIAVVVAQSDPQQRTTSLLTVALAALAGMTIAALIGWSYFGWRLNRIATDLERTLETDEPIALKEGGIPAERRLARALNTAAGAFMQVEARATHDRLTGVANRETLLSTLVAEVERATRHHKPLSVAFIDIDRFKPINDSFGQWASDTATQALASVLAPQPHHRGRPSDMIAALATGIGHEMSLPRDEIERIRIASLLHDLGK